MREFLTPAELEEKTMFNPPPTPSVFSWPQAYWCGGVACYAYCDDETELVFLQDHYNVSSYQLIDINNDIENRIAVIKTPDYLYLGIEGTARAAQWGSYLYQTYPVDREGWLGKYVLFFSSLADNVVSRLAGVTFDRPVVICGHSLGGAVAAIVAEQLKRNGVNVAALWTFGAPRPASHHFADNYTIPSYQLIGQNDLVPELPPDLNPYIFPYDAQYPSLVRSVFPPLSHVGERIAVGDLDISEVADNFQQTQEASFYRAVEGIGGHFMASYQEAIWVRLSAEWRGRLTDMFNSLDRLGKQGQIDFALPVAEPAEQDSLLELSHESEADLFAQLTGDAGKLTLHLFESPAVVPDDATLATFTEAAFPGYAPRRLPASTLSDDAGGGQVSERVSVRFSLSQSLGAPRELRGVYAVVNDGGGSRLVNAYAFPAVKAIMTAGDFIDVHAQCTVARVY